MTTPVETPLFFEHAGRRLYGVHYPARDPASSRSGLILCQAPGHEADLSLRVLVDFARLAAQAGIDVLRFDYTGCGESQGDFEDATVEGWLEDVAAGMRFLRDRTGVDAVGLLGLRLGGTLAALAAQRQPAVNWVCLWEPIMTPTRYVDELLQMQLISHNLWASTPLQSRQQLFKRQDGTVELMGYCWRRETLEALQQLEVLSVVGGLAVPCLAVGISPAGNTSKTLKPLEEVLRQKGDPCAFVQVSEAVFWQTTSRPFLDVHTWHRQDRLFSETLRWMTANALLASHA